VFVKRRALLDHELDNAVGCFDFRSLFFYGNLFCRNFVCWFLALKRENKSIFSQGWASISEQWHGINGCRTTPEFISHFNEVEIE
jgi:hypothetical protein